MAKKFKNLFDKMSAQSQHRAKEKTKKMLIELESRAKQQSGKDKTPR